MEQVSRERGQIDLNIGFFDNLFNADELSCMDQPIAACASLYDEKNYYIYSFYIIFMNNWFYPVEGSFLERRQQILRKMGLSIIDKKANGESFLGILKENVDKEKVSILYLRRQTLVYDQGYKDIGQDSTHGILVSGYNEKWPTICIRDAAHIERSGAKYEGSGYGFFRLWLREDLLYEMWKESGQLLEKTEFAYRIFGLEKVRNVNSTFSYKNMLEDIIKNGDFEKNSLIEWLGEVKNDLSILKNQEMMIYIRRIFILPKNAFFRIMEKICEESDIYLLNELENTYVMEQKKIINRVCVWAIQGIIVKEDFYNKAIDIIRNLDEQIKKFIYYIVEKM